MVKTIPKHSARPTTLMDRLEAEELEKKEGAKALGDLYADVAWDSFTISASKWIVFEHAVTKSTDHGPIRIVAL